MLTSMSPASVTLVEPAPPSPKDVLGGGSKKQLKHGGSGGRKEVLLEHIQAVREQLTEAELAQVDDAMIHRYVRAAWGAHGPDLKHTVKRIRDTLAWWAKDKPQQMVCTACQADPKAHYMHVVGHDLADRPVIYSCLELASNRNIEDNRRHMISTFEQAIRLMPDGVESWAWVLDFQGFGLADCDPRLAKIFLNVSAAHYPERLGTFFIVSAPMLFNTLWKAIAPLVDPVTREKIHFVNFEKKGDNPKLRTLLQRYMDEELTEWLMAEMGDNRNKAKAVHKCYSYPDLCTLAHDPEHDIVKRAAEQRRSFSSRGHDHLGSPRLLHTLSGNPEALLPGLQQLRLTP